MLELVGLFCVLCLTIYSYYNQSFQYWKKKNVPTPVPRFPAGNITRAALGRESLYITIKNCYKKFKAQGEKHVGLYFFNGPAYVPIDLEIIKAILSTDFEYFADRGVPSDEKKFPLSINLFNLRGGRWKNLKNKISPIFSSSKLKAIYDLFLMTTEVLIDFVKVEAESKNEELNITKVVSDFSTNVITTTLLGVKDNKLGNIPEIVNRLFHPGKLRFYKNVILRGFNRPEKITQATQSNTDISKHISNVIKDTIEQKDKLSTPNSKNDLLSLLLTIRDKEGLSINEIIGTCFSFFIAGHDTAANVLSITLHELANHQEAQDRLRQEISQKLGHDFKTFSYDDVLNLKYLEWVIFETLRIYPALTYLNRLCLKDYKVPGVDVTIEKNTPVLIPVLGLHHDPEFFPDPKKFNPERFQNSENIVPFSFLPFGKGPRQCIGMRYGLLQTKLGIAALVSQYKFYPGTKTSRDLKYDNLTTSINATPKSGINLKVIKINKNI